MENKKFLRGLFIFFGIFLGLILTFAVGVMVIGSRTYNSGLMTTYKTEEFNYENSSSPSLMQEGFDGFSDFGYQGDFVGEESHDRSLIKTGNISLAVDHIDDTLAEIEKIQQRYGATKVSLDDYGKDLNRNVSITIKVEESSFEQLYAALKTLEGEFEGSSVNVSDITDTVIDLEARLKNHKSVETQYLTILGSAKTVEDTLAVQKELNQVRLDIERIETQLRNLATQTDYSYIDINISQSISGAEVIEQGWRPLGIVKNAFRALLSLGKFLGAVLIWLVVFSPIIALVVIPIVLLKKKAKK